jgi:peptidoglycan/xylan/chitin deacetylase (PgdA/CDA1 family)
MADFLPILTFHTLEDQLSAISFSTQVFRRGMAGFHEKGYRAITLLEAVDSLRQKVPFPERSLVITFDDGYQTIYDVAFPILQRYGMSATVFLTTGGKGMATGAGRLSSIKGRSMLSWDEIREMHRCGVTFGAHTLTHPDLTRLTFDQIKCEIFGSKSIIEDALGAPVTSFAYPYGRYDVRIRELVQQHFTCACSDKFGLITSKSVHYSLERIDACYFRTERLFGLILTRLFPWYIWARNIPLSIRGAFRRSSGRWNHKPH